MKLHSSQCASHSRVCVTINDDSIWLNFQYHLFDGLKHSSCLLAMCSAADPKVIVWRGYAEFFKKHIAHVGIIMLSSVDKNFRVLLPQFSAQWCRFDELGPCPNDSYEFHLTLLSWETSHPIIRLGTCKIFFLLYSDVTLLRKLSLSCKITSLSVKVI